METILNNSLDKNVKKGQQLFYLPDDLVLVPLNTCDPKEELIKIFKTMQKQACGIFVHMCEDDVPEDLNADCFLPLDNLFTDLKDVVSHSRFCQLE